MVTSMAGTSNDSCYSPSGPSLLFSVYLSFRGIDTWKTFSGHLPAALDQAGIRTFKDDRQLKGEESSVELIDPIRESMISIVVFSKNYCSSRLCLEELVEIMECRRKSEHVVFPVYYDVNPSEMGSFAKAFAIRKDFSTDQIDHVQRCAAALQEASSLSGYQLTDYANGDEAVLIKSIVEEVRFKAQNKKFPYVAQYPVGIESRVRDIYQILSIGSNDVRFIGIYGMAGIGKTSAVKAIYNKTSHHFERSCFLINIREASYKSHGLVSLQEQLIFKLLKRNFKVLNVDEGIRIMKYGLYSIRALIVLDDLDIFAQLTSLTGNASWYGAGSRVIITTRDVGLLHKIQVDSIYEVMELDHYESLELFSRHAFRNTIPLKDFMELSEGIVSYIGGLPLALKLIGSDLFGRTMEEWKSAFAKMQQIPHRQIQEILRISYDALNDDMEKEIFLDIACFFIGMDRDDAISIMDGCGCYSVIGIYILRERCLLTIDGENQLRMHNLIRDMGREIVREESLENPEKRSRLWCHKDAYDVLGKLKGTETIKGIKLEMTMPENEHLTTTTFKKMPNLRLLQISNVHLTGSFENLFTELRWLCWHYCPLKCLPSSFHPRKLVLLDMQYSNVHRLWHGAKHLRYLRILNVSHSRFLITTPDFEGLEMLEKLLLRNCSSLEQIHPSIELLSELSHLDLNGCFKLNRLPEQLGNLEGLKKLDASGTAIKKLPDSIGHLRRLVELSLEGCKNLKNLPSSICHLISLEVLNLDSCLKLKKFPEKLGDIECLRWLDASRTAIEQLPDSIGHLSRLVKLKLEGCENLRELPSSIFHLISLEILSLESCLNLHLINCTSLQSLLEFPPSLKELDLTNCSSLQSLPELPPNLENIYARGCTSLEKLPILSRLNHLKSLNLENCSSLQLLMDLPPNLCELDLTNCSNLRALPILHPNLHRLSLTGCNSLESLPEIPSDLEFLTF